jgi:hypothetical protein
VATAGVPTDTEADPILAMDRKYRARTREGWRPRRPRHLARGSPARHHAHMSMLEQELIRLKGFTDLEHIALKLLSDQTPEGRDQRKTTISG